MRAVLHEGMSLDYTSYSPFTHSLSDDCHGYCPLTHSQTDDVDKGRHIFLLPKPPADWVQNPEHSNFTDQVHTMLADNNFYSYVDLENPKERQLYAFQPKSGLHPQIPVLDTWSAGVIGLNLLFPRKRRSSPSVDNLVPTTSRKWTKTFYAPDPIDGSSTSSDSSLQSRLFYANGYNGFPERGCVVSTSTSSCAMRSFLSQHCDHHTLTTWEYIVWVAGSTSPARRHVSRGLTGRHTVNPAMLNRACGATCGNSYQYRARRVQTCNFDGQDHTGNDRSYWTTSGKVHNPNRQSHDVDLHLVLSSSEVLCHQRKKPHVAQLIDDPYMRTTDIVDTKTESAIKIQHDPCTKDDTKQDQTQNVKRKRLHKRPGPSGSELLIRKRPRQEEYSRSAYGIRDTHMPSSNHFLHRKYFEGQMTYHIVGSRAQESRYQEPYHKGFMEVAIRILQAK